MPGQGSVPRLGRMGLLDFHFLISSSNWLLIVVQYDFVKNAGCAVKATPLSLDCEAALAAVCFLSAVEGGEEGCLVGSKIVFDLLIYLIDVDTSSSSWFKLIL